MTEDKLIGWLCIARLQWTEDRTVFFPTGVTRMLVEKGWLAVDPGSDLREAHMTEAGVTITDLYAPEWGIDPVGEPA